MPASSTATSTINTFLMHIPTVAGAKPTTTEFESATKVMDIKDYPDFGGEPEQVESTTLSDSVQTFVNGVQQLDAFTFTANYIMSVYESLKELESKGEDEWWAVAFGAGSDGEPDGHDGIVAWQGGLTAWINGGEVNAVREMSASISVKTKPELVKSA